MIKLFEEYNSYYSEIEFDEYQKCYINWLRLNSYITDASKLFSKINEIVCDEFESKLTDSSSAVVISEIEDYPGENFHIIILYDDWYLVSHEEYILTHDSNYARVTRYYKCDQYDGLMKLLDDFDVINE